MAKITDLPPELVQRIIEHTILLSRENEPWQQQHFLHHHQHHHHEHTNQNNTHIDATGENTENNRAGGPTQNLLNPTTSETHHPSSNQPNTPPIFAINDFTIFGSGDFNGDPSTPINTSCDEHANHPQVSWPDGLPSEPLVPFSLVNRTFQQCAQEMLFRHVALYSPWQANLFLRTLNRSKAGSPIIDHESVFTSIPVDVKGKRRVECNKEIIPSPRNYRRLNRLGDHVRSLKFMWMGPASMGKGGGSLICDVLKSCPLLENIAISTALLSHCKEPLFEALETRTLIKEFLILKNPVENTRKFLWQADEVLSRLFTRWDFLETVEIIGLSGRPRGNMDKMFKSIPTFSCSLKIISLIRPNLAELELKAFLKNSKATLNTLQITYPTSKLGRAGLYRILKDCTSSELESLTIQVGKEWHPINTKRTGPNETEVIIVSEEDPNQNPHLADILFKSSTELKQIKSLSISGPLASSKLFNHLPDSIVKLAWEDCSDIHPASFAKFLSSWSKPLKSAPPIVTKDNPLDSNDSSGPSIRTLPNLKCCSVGTDDFTWKRSDRRAVENALRERNACFHSSNCQALFPPAWFRPSNNSEDEQANTEEDFDLMTDVGWPHSEMEYNQNDMEDDDDDEGVDDEEDDENDQDDGDDGDEDDEGGGGANGNRSERSRNNQWGRMQPPPMLFPGLFSLPMAAYTFPLNRPTGGGGHDEGATTWLFGGGTTGSSANRPPHPTNLPPHPNRSSSSSTTTPHNQNNANSTSTESPSIRPYTCPHNQPSSSSSATRPSSSSTVTNNNNNSSTQDHRTNANPPASSSTATPKSPRLFGSGFKFERMF